MDGGSHGAGRGANPIAPGANNGHGMTMKRILLLALGAMISLQAGARTLYVDASRPNNNGNGLKATTAKKTIQAAVNAAKAGDTIVVLPGTYAPITTKNKKIAIKAKSGAAKTAICYSGTKKADSAVVKLGKAWVKRTPYHDENGNSGYVTESSGGETKGTSTSVTGFTIDGDKAGDDQWDNVYGVSGGTLKSCVIQNVSGNRTVCRANLTDCTLRDNSYLLVDQATLTRCKIQSNKGYSWYGKSTSSKFANCLLALNDTVPMTGCTLANCTVADNTSFSMSSTKAWNTIFYRVASSQFAKKRKNTLTKCYKGKTPRFASPRKAVTNWFEVADSRGAVDRPEMVSWLATNEIDIVTKWLEQTEEKDIYTNDWNYVVVTNWTEISSNVLERLVSIPDPTKDHGNSDRKLKDENGVLIKTDDWFFNEQTNVIVNLTNLFVYPSGTTLDPITGGTSENAEKDDDGNPLWTPYGLEHRFYLNPENSQYAHRTIETIPVPIVVTNDTLVTYLKTETKTKTIPGGKFDGNWGGDWTYSDEIAEADGSETDLGTTTNFVTKTVIETIHHYWRYEEDVSADYHLTAKSPCINKGTKSATAKKLFGSKDLDRKKRIRGKTVDIGCYEY